MKNYMNTVAKNKSKLPNAHPSPKKVKTLAGVHFSTKASTKTLGVQMHSSIKRSTDSVKRSTDRYDLCATTRSIDQLHCNSSVENEETIPMIPSNSKEQEELFSCSYLMIGKIKQSYPFKTMDKELNEVLTMLNQEKIKISEKIKTLKKSNQYYKQICQNANRKTTVERQINTEQAVEEDTAVVSKDEAVSCDIEAQREFDEQIQKTEKVEKTKDIYSSEAYMKLSKMLQDMNINPKNILPYEETLNEVPHGDFKTLSDREIIKIQRFFIKKLVQKMPK